MNLDSGELLTVKQVLIAANCASKEKAQKHINSCANISVSCLLVNGSRASDFGLVKVDERGRTRQFLEKPNGELLRSVHVDTSVFGLSAQEAREFPYIASMGIYVFKIDVLLNLLRGRYPNANDFGSEVIPMAAKDFNVQLLINALNHHVLHIGFELAVHICLDWIRFFSSLCFATKQKWQKIGQQLLMMSPKAVMFNAKPFVFHP